MKKILILAALPLIIFLFSFKSYAMTQDQFKSFLDREEINYTDEQINTYFPANELQNYDYVAYMHYLASLNTIRFYFCNYDDLEWHVEDYGSDIFGYGFQRNGSYNFPSRLRGVRYSSQVGFTNGESNWQDVSECRIVDTGNTTLYNYGISYSNIDWETIYYNPQIPVPKLDVWYLITVNSFLNDYEAVVNANIDVPDSTEFYVELAWKWSVPEQIRVYPSDIKGTPAYDYEYYTSSELIPIYSLQDMQQSINLHISGSDLKQTWQDYYDTYYDSINFYTPSNDVPNSWLANARLAYIKKMGTQLPMYGNRLEIFARYWTISEDEKVVVGKWYHWQSAKGSATEEPPSNYVNYQQLPGYAGTVENVPTGDENTYTGTGETTGEQATTVINYAPNYPDYPTAVSYNHDNILLQMIQTSKQLPQFFGQFTNFLAITLAFIDPGVWAIIGFGFTCCIVIMIIKVL